MKRRPRAFGAACRPLNASVRLPIVVPHLEVSARMSSAMNLSLRFRGPIAAAVQATPRGDQAIAAIASSCPGAGCVNRHRLGKHEVPRSRASSGRQRRDLARTCVSSGSSVRLGGVCRCRRVPAVRSPHLRRLALFETNSSSSPGLYGGAPSAYGARIMRQPNYALQRTGNQPHFQFRPQRAAAERER
jgi:hypothetical protein